MSEKYHRETQTNKYNKKTEKNALPSSPVTTIDTVHFINSGTEKKLKNEIQDYHVIVASIKN